MRWALVLAVGVAVAVATLPVAGADEGVVGVRVLKKPKQCARQVQDGDYILLHYVARVIGRDEPFHSTYEAGAPMPLIVGSGQYFKGFHKGSLLGMCEKEVRQLTIPSSLAFGKAGFGTLVPPNADVEYTVKVMEWMDDEKPKWR